MKNMLETSGLEYQELSDHELETVVGGTYKRERSKISNDSTNVVINNNNNNNNSNSGLSQWP